MAVKTTKHCNTDLDRTFRCMKRKLFNNDRFQRYYTHHSKSEIICPGGGFLESRFQIKVMDRHFEDSSYIKLKTRKCHPAYRPLNIEIFIENAQKTLGVSMVRVRTFATAKHHESKACPLFYFFLLLTYRIDRNQRLS